MAARHTLLFEIFYDGDWHTVPTYNRSEVTISRGRQDQLQRVSPAQLSGVQINNRDGTYSPRNPESSLYGKIGRNTRCRFSVDGDIRFVGEVEAWPQRWSKAGIDVWVPITAYGIMQRLGLPGQKAAAQSALVSTVIYTGGSDLLAYWPMEDDTDATTFGSLVDGSPLAFTDAELSSDDTLPGSAALPVFTATTALNGRITGGTAGTWQMLFYAKFAGGAPATRTTFLEVDVAEAGTVAKWIVEADATTVYITGVNSAGTSVFSGSSVNPHAAMFGGDWVSVDLLASDGGAALVTVAPYSGSVGNSASTGGGITAGYPTRFRTVKSAEWADLSMGHVVVVTGLLPFVYFGPTTAPTGYNLEPASERIFFVCDRAGIPAPFTTADSAILGPQPIDSPLEIMFDAQASDMGILYEPRDDFGIVYRALTEMYNLPPTATLTYGQKEIGDLQPTPDLDLVQNDITVKRRGGAKSRLVQETGPLNVQDPTDDPQGVGRFPVEAEISLGTDDQILDQAGWRLHVGTTDVERYPVLLVDIDALTAQSKTTLVDSLIDVDLGDRILIEVETPVAGMPPDDIDLHVQGSIERVSLTRRTIEFITTPYRPYQVAVLAEDTLTLLTAQDTTSVTFRVGCQPDFTEDSADLPRTLTVDGEEVTVTAVAAVAVALAAGTPAHGSNASVTPGMPTHVEGDLMLLFAAIRNSGTGTVDAVSGWTSLYQFGNTRVFGKYATSAADADPTVTFTGGVANATTSAVVIRARGCQLEVLNSKEQLNGSAQDIAYPHFVQEGDVQVFHFCWKQDDFTSVAFGSGFANEIVEASTTTGDDQSLYVARGPTVADATPIAAGSHTVTGGASAISRGVFLTVPRGVFDLTVTRSTNGVTASHSRGATVQVAAPAILAL